MFDEFASNAPIRFHGLVVETTTRCNAKCAMCYQSVGPKGSDSWGKVSLDTEKIKKAISEAAKIDLVDPRFHLSGGEAFIDLEQCLEVLRHAKSVGFLVVSATTNAFWAQNAKRAQQVCEQVAAAGLNRFEISWDVWHLPFIRPETIKNCLLACRQVGISTNLRVLTTKIHSAGEALSLLDDEAVGAASEISSGPVFPTGRANLTIDSTDIYREQDLGGACFASLNLTINPKGQVYPCCAGADQTDSLQFGNVDVDSLSAVVTRMQESILLRILVFYGPGAFVGLLKKHSISLGINFASICHMCWSIFSDSELDRKVRELLEAEL